MEGEQVVPVGQAIVAGVNVQDAKPERDDDAGIACGGPVPPSQDLVGIRTGPCLPCVPDGLLGAGFERDEREACLGGGEEGVQGLRNFCWTLVGGVRYHKGAFPCFSRADNTAGELRL